MVCTVLLELTVKPECVDEMITGLGAMLPDTRKYDGCIEVYATQDQDAPTTIVAVEKWESRQHYEKYLAWRTESGAMDGIAAMVTQPPSIRFFDIKA